MARNNFKRRVFFFFPLVKKLMPDVAYEQQQQYKRELRKSLQLAWCRLFAGFEDRPPHPPPQEGPLTRVENGTLGKLTFARQQSAGAPNLFPRLLSLEIRRQMDGSRWNKAGNCIRTSL